MTSVSWLLSLSENLEDLCKSSFWGWSRGHIQPPGSCSSPSTISCPCSLFPGNHPSQQTSPYYQRFFWKKIRKQNVHMLPVSANSKKRLKSVIGLPFIGSIPTVGHQCNGHTTLDQKISPFLLSMVFVNVSSTSHTSIVTFCIRHWSYSCWYLIMIVFVKSWFWIYYKASSY